MRRALALAARGLGETNPNPAVGCVVARGGRVVGEGFHARAGGPHAEVGALREAGPRARGATLYVTLEPCAHQGRTPPCAPLVRDVGRGARRGGPPRPEPARGRTRARAAAPGRDRGRDGPPRRGGGAAQRALPRAGAARPPVRPAQGGPDAGRKDRHGVGPLEVDHEPVAASARPGGSGGCTTRSSSGIGTALADDPLLLPSPRTRRPFLRVVLDSRLRLPERGRLARSAGPRTPVLALSCAPDPSRRRRLEAAGVEVVDVAGETGRVSLPAALEALGARGVTSVMVEGGGEVLGSFLAARLADQVALFRAPLLLGGRGSRPAFGGPDPLEIRRGPPPRARAGRAAVPLALDSAVRALAPETVD